ncbi:hypothetical protein [Bosea sp. (in: a-proteobacteria)]
MDFLFFANVLILFSRLVGSKVTIGEHDAGRACHQREDGPGVVAFLQALCHRRTGSDGHAPLYRSPHAVPGQAASAIRQAFEAGQQGCGDDAANEGFPHIRARTFAAFNPLHDALAVDDLPRFPASEPRARRRGLAGTSSDA